MLGRSLLWRRTLAAVKQDLADKGFLTGAKENTP